MTECYVYKWTHKPSLMWYVGSRTAKKSYPFDGYICSSKTVKPMILSNPTEWTREIVAVGSKEEMIELEREILETFDARNDPRSFNQSNGLRPIAYWTGKKRNPSWNKGMSGEQHHRYGKKLDYKKTFTKSEKWLSKQREMNKLNNSVQVSCILCRLTGQKNAMSRHYAPCALKQKGGV